MEIEGHFCPRRVERNTKTRSYEDLRSDGGVEDEIDEFVRGLGAGRVFWNRAQCHVFQAAFDGIDPLKTAGKLAHQSDRVSAVN